MLIFVENAAFDKLKKYLLYNYCCIQNIEK
jgi:hypothetical protein